MPRIVLMDPFGMCYEITTRRTETTLHAWFDEVLPYTYVLGRPGIDDFETVWPKIQVWPMWAWKTGPLSDADWLRDSRVLGRMHDFEARTGDEGLAALVNLRRQLERELREKKA